METTTRPHPARSRSQNRPGQLPTTSFYGFRAFRALNEKFDGLNIPHGIDERAIENLLYQLEQIDTNDRFHILTVTAGKLAVDGNASPPLHLGQTLLIPACCRSVTLNSVGDAPAEFLVAALP